MIKIRNEQVSALRAVAAQRIVASLAPVAEKNYPALAEKLGHDGLRALIDRLVATAAGYGISMDAGLSHFANIGCVLGEHFDRDERYPWSAAILAAGDMSPADKIERLRWWCRRELASRREQPDER
jgi:hypothetical protein